MPARSFSLPEMLIGKDNAHNGSVQASLRDATDSPAMTRGLKSTVTITKSIRDRPPEERRDPPPGFCLRKGPSRSEAKKLESIMGAFPSRSDQRSNSDL